VTLLPLNDSNVTLLQLRPAPGGVPSGRMAGDADRVWVDTMPAAYDRWLVPTVFQPFAVDLARRAAAHPVGAALELAAGTGVLTHELLGVATAVTATDLNDAMVDLGGRRVPAARWRQADATRLPFDDAAFDLVACQFGVMFFPDRPAAYAEAARVLAPGGRLLVNTWAPLDTHVFQSALVVALERVFPDDPPTFMAAVPHGYADVDAMVADVAAGGLRCGPVTAVTLEGTAASAADLAAGYCAGTPLRAEIAARGDLGTATAAVADEMTALLGTGPVTGAMTAYVVEASRGTGR
jgi:SAM-dependent methyltransferase